MYRVFYGENILHDSCEDDVILTNCKITGESNTPGSMEFTMAVTHPMRHSIERRKEEVTAYSDDTLIFCGYVESTEEDLDLNLTVSCVGELGYLSDVILRPYATYIDDKSKWETAPDSPSALFEWYIAKYNKSASRPFKVGVNQAYALDTNRKITRSSTQYPTVGAEITDKLLNMLGGYLFVRHSGSDRILDYYSDVESINTQIIDFGENLTNFARIDSTLETYTAIVPHGKKEKVEKDTSKKDEEEEETDDDVNLTEIPDGLFGKFSKVGDTIVDRGAAARYGYREIYWQNDDCHTAYGLLESAMNHLNKINEETMTVDVSAIDLSLYMENYSHLVVGQAVRVRSKPFNVDEYMMVVSCELDMLDPGNTRYTLGSPRDTLTGGQSSKIRTLNASINEAVDSIAPISDMAKSAASDAAVAMETADYASLAATSASDLATAASDAAVSAATLATEADIKASDAVSAANSADEKATNAATAAATADAKAVSAASVASAADTKATNAATAASNADKKAEDAATAAATADSKATNAASIASAADAKADSASAAATTAGEAASAASTAAAAAKSAADDAVAKASLAESSANDAAQAAEQAGQKAEQASTAASTASTKAEEAASSASAALSSAENALSEATSASTIAGSAESKASSAVTKAESAITKANEASEAASTADGKAESAVTTANSAASAASAADSKAESAATAASAAATAASNADAKAVSAASAASAADTKATNAATAASNADKKAGDAATAAANADTKATNAASAAATADAKAVNAASAAATADGKAVAAQTAANAAKTAADNAKTAADNAAKTATNYMDFQSGTGLVVGDMTAATLGKNTLIDANGMAVRDGSTEFARFAADRIELGKGLDSAEVSLGNGNVVLGNHLVNNYIDWSYIVAPNGIAISAKGLGEAGWNQAAHLDIDGNGVYAHKKLDVYGQLYVEGLTSTDGNVDVGGNLSIGGSNVSDFVTSEGMSNGWYVKTYASGYREMWTIATGNMTSTVQGVSVSFPTAFASKPVVNVNGGVAGTIDTIVKYTDADASSAWFYISSASGSGSYWAFVHVHGK